MDNVQKWLTIAVVGAAFSFCVACAGGSPSASNIPLYTMRMEQASSNMNFLPAEQNTFTYTTEPGCILTSSVAGWCGAAQPATGVSTCSDTTCLTYWPTCSTCSGDTCEVTCVTCEDTCDSTCAGYTCESTCGEPTCQTCGSTCVGPTCVQVTCVPSTCYGC